MGRIFSLAMEETIQNTIPTIPNEEITEDDIENTTKLESEADSYIETIDESEEVLDKLQSKSKENATILSNQDSDITTRDVVNSEECLKEACYLLGYPKSNFIQFSKESLPNNRELLTISQEGIKEVVLNIIVTIRNLLRKVISKIKMIYTKLLFRLKKYQLSIDTKASALKNLDINIIDKNRITNVLRESKCAELQYALIHSSPNVEFVYNKTLSKIASSVTLFIIKFKTKDKILQFFGLGSDVKKKLEDMTAGSLAQVFGKSLKLDVSRYGFKKPETTGTLVPVITGTKVATIVNYVDIKTIHLEPDNDLLARASLDLPKLIKTLIDPHNLSVVKKGAIESSRVINEVSKLQDLAASVVDSVDNKQFVQKHPDEVRLALSVIKGTCINFSMLALKAHLNAIKYYNLLLTLVTTSIKKD